MKKYAAGLVFNLVNSNHPHAARYKAVLRNNGHDLETFIREENNKEVVARQNAEKAAYFLARWIKDPAGIFEQALRDYTTTKDNQWSCGKERLVVPFQKITFSPVRMPSKSGISNVFVMVTAVDNKPFFDNETVSNQPGARYKKDLCLYKAGTQDEADESIEIIRKFMSGTLDEKDSFRL